MKVILETDRLLLREYVEDDAEAFLKLNTDPEVLRFVPDKALLNVEQARQVLIDHPIADYRKNGFGRGACILKSSGEQIGFAGLKYLKELDEVDIAYRFMPTYWGQGLATEAARASVRYGFADLGLKRIIGLVMPENTASVRVLEKAGLRYSDSVSLWDQIFKVYYRRMRIPVRTIPPLLRRTTSAAFDIVRELGLAFPRARETRYYRGLALEIDGEVFAVQTSHRSADPNSISVATEFGRREKLIADNPLVFYLRPHYQNYPVVLVRLDQIDRAELSEVLRSAYNAAVSGKVKIGRSRVASRRSTSRKKQIKRRPAR